MKGKRHKENCKRMGINAACTSIPMHVQDARDARAVVPPVTKGMHYSILFLFFPFSLLLLFPAIICPIIFHPSLF